MSIAPSETLTNGLTIAEGMRWRNGKLWFSDLLAFRVMTIDLDGKTEELAQVPKRPSGLGFTPEGDLLIVSMRDCRLLRHGAGNGTVEAADLTPLVMAYCNDMVVDSRGCAYIGDVGFDRHAGEPRKPGALIRVDPDGAMKVVATEIDFPNGAVITPDGHTLIVAETFASRLTAFDIDDAGDLHNRRVFGTMEGTPDGLALDAEGAIWIADHLGHRVVRMRSGGEITDVIDTGDRHTFACALGGNDGRTLFYSTAIGETHDDFQANKQGRIETCRVDVPAA